MIDKLIFMFVRLLALRLRHVDALTGLLDEQEPGVRSCFV
jgi:hypothetical protein